MVAKRRAVDLMPSPEEREQLARFGLDRVALDLPFPVEPVNAILVLGDPPALIDTGLIYQENLSRIEAMLRTHGLRLSDLGEIYLTHPHVDHFGLAHEIVQRSGATLFAWEGAVERFERFQDFHVEERRLFLEWWARSGVQEKWIEKSRAVPAFYRSLAEPPTIRETFAMDQPLWMAGRHRVTPIHVPGHSPWCTAFWFEDQELLISGDVILEFITPNPIWYPSHAVPPTWQGLRVYQQSLQRLQKMPVHYTLPGHGPMFTKLHGILERGLRHQRLRRERVAHWLQQGERSAFEMALQLFGKSLTEKATFLVMSETFRHLEWLEQDQCIEQIDGMPSRYRWIGPQGFGA